jgi:hypothetical protein
LVLGFPCRQGKKSLFRPDGHATDIERTIYINILLDKSVQLLAAEFQAETAVGSGWAGESGGITCCMSICH